MKDHARARWAGVVLVCGKCERKLGGGFGRDGETRLSKALRRLAGGKGREAAFGVVETGCLKVCPKGAVTVIDGNRPRDWLIVAAETPVATVMERLGLGAPASDGAVTRPERAG